MCIIIVNNKNNVLSDDILKNSYLNNPDGCGFMYINKNNKLIIDKGLYTLDAFLANYKKHKKAANSHLIIHCRIGTGSNIDVLNCHPHIINNNFAMVHNGILDISSTKQKSDTILFIERYLKNLSFQQFNDNCYLNLLADFIGIHNKFVIMDIYGNIKIINEKEGITDKQGNWFSNNSYNHNYLYAYDDEFEIFNKKEVKKVLKNLQKLSSTDIINLGDNPYIDFTTLDFIGYDNMNCIPLNAINWDIYNAYMKKYNTLYVWDNGYFENDAAIYTKKGVINVI